MEEGKGADSKETEEYEDDFEKDLEWLINEKEKRDVGIMEMACGNEENLSPELKENETGVERAKGRSDPGSSLRDEVAPRSDFISVPSSQPVDPGSDSDSESSFQESKLDSQKDLEEDEDEEVKRYIMEKIVQANKLLQNQEPVNDKRERKLKFKDKLVDLEVPPLEDTDNYKYYFESESHVSGKLSELRISSESGQDSVLLSVTGGSFEESKDRKILVERDGKFELVNLQDIESQGCLSPIHKVSSTENGPQQSSPRSSSSPVNGVKKEEPAAKTHGSSAEEPWASVPPPPPSPRTGPSPTAHSDSTQGSGKPNRRTQSANISPVTSTYCLSPRQKELQKRLEEKREKLKREEEQRKIEEEKEKKKENDTVFKAWLQKKREQVTEMRRVQRAKQLEAMSSKQENRDPQQAFQLWLKKKHEEQLRERKTEELRKQEEFLFFLKGAAGRDRAFKQWLRRKRVEQLVEQQAAKERARQLRREARRARQLQSQLYNTPEAQSFRFTDYYS
ncbi:coiled-coil domain-containing protein 181 isoform X1 [Sturnira hondurensis]|uniref:coiled-coil domain-containing protein 181 isoform X1 n=1 Tax=Sturnira hondurensis TaxID=192404 RepID=UPI00187AAD24|nr:coiled-coil domain-containing protein 181 isoform X1 [Sturnira hondurensis]XP_036890835.1 coiled-coil domain-containing protein 181 isoform X1 [Sturnira hondurensis]XP_036890836.1 coiled-coil domain-containing protein 181 isoform X1 [Sturnira hondurensis]